jgi:hypothetical protein
VVHIACRAAKVHMPLCVHVAGYGKKKRVKKGRLFTARENGTKSETTETTRETAGRNLKGKRETKLLQAE